MPALFPLLAFLLAYILSYHIPVSASFGALALGFFLLVIGLINKAAKLRKRLFRIALFIALTALFGLRLTYLPDYRLSKESVLNTSCTELQEGIKSRLHKTDLSPKTQALALAMALGYIERNAEGQAMRQEFIGSGVAHILAVSGFHLAVVTGLIALLLRPLPYRGRSKLLQILLLLVVTWLFTWLTGASRPTIRAAFMLSLYLFGRALDRPISMLNILALSLLIQLNLIPTLMYSAGFWLSHVAVLSIYLFYRKIYTLIPVIKQKVLSYTWESFALTLSVQILIIPLCFYFFGGLSWAFLLTSLPITLLATLFIPLSLLFFLCNALGFAPFILSYCLEVLGNSISQITSFASSIDCLYQEFDLPFWGLMLYYALVISLLFYKRIAEIRQLTLKNRIVMIKKTIFTMALSLATLGIAKAQMGQTPVDLQDIVYGQYYARSAGYGIRSYAFLNGEGPELRL